MSTSVLARAARWGPAHRSGCRFCASKRVVHVVENKKTVMEMAQQRCNTDRDHLPGPKAPVPIPSSTLAFVFVLSCSCRSCATSNASKMTARNNDRSVNFPMRTQVTKNRLALFSPLLRIVLYIISTQLSRVSSCTAICSLTPERKAGGGYLSVLTAGTWTLGLSVSQMLK